MSKFTAPQIKALKSAAGTGNAWNAWGNVYRTSTNRMMQALCAQGLLTHDGRPTDKTASALGVPVAYGSAKVGSAVISAGIESEHPPLDAVGVSKGFGAADVEKMHECEIPGAPGRFVGKDATLEFAFAPSGADPKDIPASEWRKIGVVNLDGIEHDVSAPSLSVLGVDKAAPGGGFTTRSGLLGLSIQMVGRIMRRRGRGHNVPRYNSVRLGIDTFKVISIRSKRSIEAYDAAMRQDDYVCRIELELARYDGKRRTANGNKKVEKLRRILRTLKRGIYE